jgi:Proline racemase
MKNAVVVGNDQIDRSPRGTGTSAKGGSRYVRGKLKKDELFVYESIMGTPFKARIVEDAKVCGMAAAIPQITGSAYITGINCMVLDETDPFRHGFQIQACIYSSGHTT